MTTANAIFFLCVAGIGLTKNRLSAVVLAGIGGTFAGGSILLAGLKGDLEDCRAYQASRPAETIDYGMVIEEKSDNYPWKGKASLNQALRLLGEPEVK